MQSSRSLNVSVTQLLSPSKSAPTTQNRTKEQNGFLKRTVNSNKKLKPTNGTTNGMTHQMTTNSKDSKRFPYNDNNLSAYYSAMLNLTPEIGSVEEGKRLFGVLVRPVANFMGKYWEQEPIRVERNCPDFYNDLLSSQAIDKMLRQNYVAFTKNVSIQFKNGKETTTPSGRARAPTIWQYYKDGNGITISNPETFLPTIHSMNETLQEYFHCTINSKIFLSSKSTVGFAPRCDDIDTFVLQIEGEMHWRVYKPLHRSNMSSFESKKVGPIGGPLLNVVLKAGDLLYVPRGFLYESFSDSHSLHLTLNFCRKQTYGDLLKILLSMTLEDAAKENVSLRKGVPVDIWKNMGIVNNYKTDAGVNEIKECLHTVFHHADTDILDNAVDRMALRYLNDALPPKLTTDEELCSVYGTRVTVGEDGRPKYFYIGLDTKIRLMRGNVVRMVKDDDGIRLYYNSENSMENHEIDKYYVEVNPSSVAAVKVLVKAYPSFVTPRDLQLGDNDENLFVAQFLWERGILLTEKPSV